jgi:nucleoside phosphorylase
VGDGSTVSEWGADRRADVVVLTALRMEFDAMLQVHAGAVPGSEWELVTGPNGLPVAFRWFEAERGRPLRVAVAVSPDVGATSAVNTLLPLIDRLEPRCVSMCGVCAGRHGETRLGDVVAAERLFYHDTGKQFSDHVQQDITTYKLRDDWKLALEGLDVVTLFRDADWFQRRPLTTEWRERRALIALRDGVPDPWNAVEPGLGAETWRGIVDGLRERELLAASGGALTEAGRRAADDLLFAYQGALPDLSPGGVFHPFRLHVAPIGSGARVIEDDTIWHVVSQTMRKTLALEMESAALGELVHRQRERRLDVVVMKGVMDFADPGRDDHFKVFAARAAAECLIAFLRRHLPTELAIGFDDLLVSGTWPAPNRAPSPSFLLNARHTVVPWYDGHRSELLADLDAWADDPDQNVAVRLLHAAGGVGKTRLAIEWTRRRRVRHDVVGFLVPRPGDRWLERLCGIGFPILIVIDYAESRADLIEVLERIAAYAAVPGPRRRVRVLLLARGDGDWWTELQRGSMLRRLLCDVVPLKLPALAVTALQRETVFIEAALVFAAVRGKPAVLRPPFALIDERFERVLYVHMAALAAVEGIRFDAGTLMDAILDHEERFWVTEAAARYAAAVDVALARQLVAAGTLRGGLATESDAREMCARVTRRLRSRDDDMLITLLHHVYERVDEPEYLPGLEPDLLGEGVVLRVAAPPKGVGVPAGDSWIDCVFVRGDDEPTLTTAFTVLGRASATDASAVRPWVMTLLRTDFTERAVLALRAAKAVGLRTAFSALGDLLADALEHDGTTAIAHALQQEQIPSPTVSLLRVAMWRSRMLLENVTPGDDTDTMAARAALLAQNGRDLAASGMREPALTMTQDASDLYRTLTTRNPGKFQSDLATILNDLGFRLSDLGQYDAALATTQEAVELCRALLRWRPDGSRLPLARTLRSLSNRLKEVGQPETALAAAREAADHYRALATQDPDEFWPELAATLSDLSVMWRNLGQHEQALSLIRDATDVYRVLATQNPDAFQPGLAAGLGNLGVILSALGQRDAALAATRDAADTYRALAARNPDAFQPALAKSLNNLGAMLSDLGNREAALVATRDATEIYRVLATRNPDAFQAELAMSLNNLGIRLYYLGQREAALVATREGIEHRRQLARQNPDAYRADLAMSLINLGVILSGLARAQPALAATSEAVDLYRELAKRNPDVFLLDLAKSVDNMGVMLSELGQDDSALAATRESVDLHRRLATRNPDALQPSLAMCLNNLGNRLSKVGQLEAAIGATRESVERFRALATGTPEAFQPGLARALLDLGCQLCAVSQPEAGLAATREAVEIFRRLAARIPDAFQSDFVAGLLLLGGMLCGAGQLDSAFAIVREALDLCRLLLSRNPDRLSPDLDAGLESLGAVFGHMTQHNAAVAVAREARDLCRLLKARRSR